MEHLLISKLDVKHYPLHLWTTEKSPVTVLGCLVSACKITEVEGCWCKLCPQWHSKGESWETCISGIGSMQQYWPMHSALLLPIFVSSRSAWVELPKGEELIFQSQKGDDDWVGGKMGVFPWCVVPLSFLRMHFILSLKRATALQGIRGSAEVLLTQLLQGRITACNHPPGKWAHSLACLVPSSPCPTSSLCITAVTLKNA